MHLTTLQFPEVQLQQRDGHKLRGYFAHLFGEESDLFHNHGADGKDMYRYPRIQYKVIRSHPVVVGIDEGAQLLTERFLRIQQIEINGNVIALHQKDLKSKEHTIAVGEGLYTYQFLSPWQALNPTNFRLYMEMSEKERTEKLKKILIGNMMSFCKGIGYQVNERILVTIQLKEVPIQFKNKQMTGFKGQFTSNILLPDWIGLGKSSARGFGVIEQI